MCIRDRYYTITNNLRTLDQRYKFPSILIKYRQGINPVRALYFEIAECRINFDLSNASHRFVYDIFLQEHFFPQLRLDIEYDIISLQKLEQRYIDIKTNYPFFTYPLSYYHVQEMIKDFKKWGDVYKDFNENIIKELKRKYDQINTLINLTRFSVSSSSSALPITNTQLAGSIADSKLNTITTADKVSAAAIQVDGATDGTGITLATTDKLIVDDAGTTKYINASQLNTYLSGQGFTTDDPTALAIALGQEETYG